MSLFSIISEKNKAFIDPLKVNIEGDINGIVFSGHIDAIFENSNTTIEKLKVLIGNELNNKIGFHDVKLKIDDNQYKILMQQIKESETTFKKMESEGEQVIFGFGNEFYSTLYISNVLQKQKVTLSVDFELPISFIANNIVIFFPLTYTGSLKRETLKCNDFNFAVRSSLYELNEKSATSNIDGHFDSETSKYIIDHLDSSISNIMITIDPNIPKIDENFFNSSQNNQIQHEDNIGICSGKYGSIKFVPHKKEQEDYSGEEFIFIIDCSGSMRGSSIQLARECLILFIKSLPKNCCFNVVRFGTDFESFFDEPVLYSSSNVDITLNRAKNIDADLDCTNLSKPFNFVFSKKPSKIRRVFVITDGFVDDRDEVISLVKENSKQSICNAIGISNSVDKQLVEQIGKEGNGFTDFVSSENDNMKSTVINQLSKSMKGYCSIEMSIENNESFETVPPLSNELFIPGEPVTLYFKTSNEITENTHVMIDVIGNEEQTIIELKNISKESRIQKSLEFMFNNLNLKYLRQMEMTNEIKSEIIEKSIEYEILSPFIGLIGIREFSSQEEKEKTINIIKELRTNEIEYEIYNCPNVINIKTVAGKKISFNYNPSNLIGELKQSIYEKEGIPINQIHLVYRGRILNDNDLTFKDYSIQNNDTAHLVLRLRSDCGGVSGQYKGLKSIRENDTFKAIETIDKKISDMSNDLISIISKQKIDGCWSEIPNELYNVKYTKMKNIIQNTIDLCKKIKIDKNQNEIIGTLVCLIYMKKFMIEEFKTWELIYDKGMKWLSSFNQNINWNNIISYLI